MVRDRIANPLCISSNLIGSFLKTHLTTVCFSFISYMAMTSLVACYLVILDVYLGD